MVRNEELIPFFKYVPNTACDLQNNDFVPPPYFTTCLLGYSGKWSLYLYLYQAIYLTSLSHLFSLVVASFLSCPTVWWKYKWDPWAWTVFSILGCIYLGQAQALPAWMKHVSQRFFNSSSRLTGWDPKPLKNTVAHVLLVPTSKRTHGSCWVLTRAFNKSGGRDSYWFVMRVMFSAEINRGSGEIWGQSVSQSLEPPQSAVVHILYWFGSCIAGAEHERAEDSSFCDDWQTLPERAVLLQTWQNILIHIVSHGNNFCSTLTLSGLWDWIDSWDTVGWFSLGESEEQPANQPLQQIKFVPFHKALTFKGVRCWGWDVSIISLLNFTVFCPPQLASALLSHSQPPCYTVKPESGFEFRRWGWRNANYH